MVDVEGLYLLGNVDRIPLDQTAFKRQCMGNRLAG